MWVLTAEIGELNTACLATTLMQHLHVAGHIGGFRNQEGFVMLCWWSPDSTELFVISLLIPNCQFYLATNNSLPLLYVLASETR